MTTLAQLRTNRDVRSWRDGEDDLGTLVLDRLIDVCEREEWTTTEQAFDNLSGRVTS